MKNIAILLTIIILVIVVIATQKSSTTEVVRLRDITEETTNQSQSEAILSLYDLNTNRWNGATFRSSDITDVSYNYTKEIRIEPENQWLSNEFEREQAVQEFFSRISDSLNAPVKGGKPHSSVYLPIARELNKLAQSKAEKKYLLVYNSDLKENTPGWSFYKEEKLQLLKNDPDSVRKYFESLLPLKELKGIEVHLIYQPKNAEEDESYKVVSEFYRNLLESKGATVTIGANLVL